jgi:hypothetical protein
MVLSVYYAENSLQPSLAVFLSLKAQLCRPGHWRKRKRGRRGMSKKQKMEKQEEMKNKRRKKRRRWRR